MTSEASNQSALNTAVLENIDQTPNWVYRHARDIHQEANYSDNNESSDERDIIIVDQDSSSDSNYESVESHPENAPANANNDDDCVGAFIE